MDLFVFNSNGSPLKVLHILQTSTVSSCVCRGFVRCEPLGVTQGGVDSESCCWYWISGSTYQVKKLLANASWAVFAETQTLGKLVTVRGCRNSGTLISIPLVTTGCFCPQREWQNKFSLYLRYHQYAKSILLALLCAQSTDRQAQQ